MNEYWDTHNLYHDLVDNQKDCDQQNEIETKHLHQFTLYDVGAEDFWPWLSQGDKCGFSIEIENDDGETIMVEKDVETAAVDAMAAFCRRFLLQYEKVRK